jgi:hypothetical protein
MTEIIHKERLPPYHTTPGSIIYDTEEGIHTEILDGAPVKDLLLRPGSSTSKNGIQLKKPRNLSVAPTLQCNFLSPPP